VHALGAVVAAEQLVVEEVVGVLGRPLDHPHRIPR